MVVSNNFFYNKKKIKKKHRKIIKSKKRIYIDIMRDPSANKATLESMIADVESKIRKLEDDARDTSNP